MSVQFITVLSLYCDFKGWQGGTIHQVMSDYDLLPVKDKQQFCAILRDNVNNIMDDYNFKHFACDKIGYKE